MVTNMLAGMHFKDPSVANAWIETLIAVIPAIQAKIVVTQVSCTQYRERKSYSQMFSLMEDNLIVYPLMLQRPRGLNIICSCVKKPARATKP